jgi:hypothetical protein
MRRALSLIGCAALLACAERSSGTEPFVSLESALGRQTLNHGGAHGPVTVLNTQLRNEIEFPVCPSNGKGHSQIKLNPDGSISSDVAVNNKGAESVRFAHIHHLDPSPAQTGPIIWWLTSPIGVQLDLTDRHLSFTQEAAFVNNGHFASHDAALSALKANPQEFYVNVHSDECPGGFARGFLP